MKISIANIFLFIIFGLPTYTCAMTETKAPKAPAKAVARTAETESAEVLTLKLAIQMGTVEEFQAALKDIKEPHAVLVVREEKLVEIEEDGGGEEKKTLETYVATKVPVLWYIADILYLEDKETRREALLTMVALLLKDCIEKLTPYPGINNQQLVFLKEKDTFVTCPLLHLSCMKKDEQFMTLLVNAGADPEAKDAQGKTSDVYTKSKGGRTTAYYSSGSSGPTFSQKYQAVVSAYSSAIQYQASREGRREFLNQHASYGSSDCRSCGRCCW